MLCAMAAGGGVACEDARSLIQDRRSRSDRRQIETIRTTENQNVYGKYREADYEGENCDESDERLECRKQCEEMYDDHSNLCENTPVDLVSDLHDLFEQMQHFSERSGDLEHQLDSFMFGVMIDIHIEPVLILIRDYWSPRETGKFLIWVAENHSVALALQHHDQRSWILGDAFKDIGTAGDSRSQGVQKQLAVDIGADLDGFFRTFLYLATDREYDYENDSAFIIIHELVKRECASRECKMRVYCIREEYEPGVRGANQDCPYRERRYFGTLESRHCYVHGPDVWNYWNQLHRDSEIDDNDFEKDFIFSEKKCDRLCEDVDCNRNED